MEISVSRQMTQAASSAALVPESGKKQPSSVQTVEIKAPPKVPEFEPKDIEQAVKELQDFVKGLGRDLSFRQDNTIDRSIITVFDEGTRQIVRQIPSEEVVAIARQIREGLDEIKNGLFLTEKA